MKTHVPLFTAVLTAFASLAPWSPAQVSSTEIEQYTASDGQSGDGLGASAKVIGNWAFLGAPSSDAFGVDEGAVYVYDLTTGQEQQLLATASGFPDLGTGIDSDGTLLLAGSPGSANGGMVWVYKYSAGSGLWSNWTTFTSSGFQNAGDRLGQSVGLSDSFFAAGAPYHDGTGADSGFVHLRHQVTNVKYNLMAGDLLGGDLFGFDLKIVNDVMVVGAPRHNGHGAAYIYRYDGMQWNEEDKLVPPLVAGLDRVGHAVTTDGTRALVGAPGVAGDTGVVHVFEDDGAGVWSYIGLLSAHDRQTGDEFGIDVDLVGSVAVVGAVGKLSGGQSQAGAAYQFRDTGAGFVEQQVLRSSVPALDDRLGFSASTDGVHVLLGSPETMGGGFDQGQGLLFDVPSLSLSADPNPAVLGDKVRLHVAGGEPGAKMGIVVFDVSGVPLFVPLYFTTFGADGTVTRSGVHNQPALSGLDIQMGAIGSNGPGPVALSNLVTLSLL